MEIILRDNTTPKISRVQVAGVWTGIVLPLDYDLQHSDLTAGKEKGWVEVIPNVPLEVTITIPQVLLNDNLILSLKDSDDPAAVDFDLTTPEGAAAFFTYNGPRPKWGVVLSEVATGLITPSTPVPIVRTFSIIPVMKYLQYTLSLGTVGNNLGQVTIVAFCELLPTPVYNRLMRAKKVSLKQIEACTTQVDEHEAAKVAATAKKTQLEEEMVLFDNYLSDEIALYEQIYPPTP